MGTFVDITGQKFARLTVTGIARRGGDNGVRWSVACDCGRSTTVSTHQLRMGRSKSCGCLTREATAKRSTTHGNSRGGARSAELRAWFSMRGRCKLPSTTHYHCYGGRGIKVCDRWQGRDGFANFLADVGPKPTPQHSLDRIDNDGNYEPGNVKWSTKSEQARNRRPRRKSVVDGVEVLRAL